MDELGIDTLDKKTAVERALEGSMFASRWLLAPFYLGLVGALALLLLEFVRHLVHLFSELPGLQHDDLLIGALELIDLSLMGNLVLMVMFAGYENFVSKLHTGARSERLAWMGSIGFGDLKLKLMTSIVAISAIRLLEAFMDVENMTDHDLTWTLGIHLAFVVATLMLAAAVRLMHK